MPAAQELPVIFEASILPWRRDRPAVRSGGRYTMPTAHPNVAVRFDLLRATVCDPEESYLQRDGSLLCEVTVCHLAPGIRAPDGTSLSTYRLIEANAGVHRLQLCLSTSEAQAAQEAAMVHCATLVQPVWRTESRVLFLRDFPTLTLLASTGKATPLGELFGGKVTLRMYPNGRPSKAEVKADGENKEAKEERKCTGIPDIVISMPSKKAERSRCSARVALRVLQNTPGKKDQWIHSRYEGEGEGRLFSVNLQTSEILQPGSGWLTAGDRTLAIEVSVSLGNDVEYSTMDGGLANDGTTSAWLLEQYAGEDLRSDLADLLPPAVVHHLSTSRPAELDGKAPGGSSGGGRAAFGDAILVCEGKRLPVHRAILARRSPFFAAIFSSGMRESATREVEVPNLRLPVLCELLHFLYTGRLSHHHVQRRATSESGPWMVELYGAAHMYEVHGLTRLLEAFLLSERPPPEALVPCLLFADLHKLTALKSHYAHLLQSPTPSPSSAGAYRDAVMRSAAYQEKIKGSPEGLALFLEVCTTTLPSPLTPLREHLGRLRLRREIDAATARAAETEAITAAAAGRKRKRQRQAGEAEVKREGGEWRPRLRKQAVLRLSADEMRLELAFRGLPTEGTKSDLQCRLQSGIEDD